MARLADGDNWRAANLAGYRRWLHTDYFELLVERFGFNEKVARMMAAEALRSASDRAEKKREAAAA